MKTKLGRLLIALGVISIAAAGALLFWNLNEDQQAGETAVQVLNQMEEKMPDPVRAPEITALPEGDADFGGERGQPKDMPVITIDGVDYVGTITLPTLDIVLPVAAEWDQRQAKESPCRYLGTAEGGDLILCGHNYRRHFGSIGTLRTDDPVCFTDAEGLTYTYRVIGQETIDKYDPETMEAGAWDLTLFTCTIGGKQRVTIRCVRE